MTRNEPTFYRPLVQRVQHQISWRRTVDRATVICVGFILLVQSFVCVSALATTWRTWPEQDVVRVAVVIVCNVTLVTACFVVARRPTPAGLTRASWPMTAVAILAVVAASGLAAPSPLPPAALQIIPVNSIQAVQLAVVGFGLSWRAGAATILLTGPMFIAMRHAAAGVGVVAGLDEWALPAATSVAILAVLGHLRAGADVADVAIERAHGEAVQAATRTNAELIRDEARRVVHDDVISALRAAELGLPPEQVRTASSWALASLDGVRRVASLEDFEDQLRRGVSLDFTLTTADWTEPPPPRVLAAMKEATAEALRNAERHGHAQRATIVVSSSALRTEVVIVDDGLGLPSDWQPGFGVRDSMVGRLDEIGGHAQLEDGDDGGATVRLTWPKDLRRHGRTGAILVPDRKRVAWVLAATCAATTSYAALRFPGVHPASGFAVGGAILLMIAVASHQMAQPDPLARRAGLRHLAPAGAVLCGVLWWGLVAAGEGALLSIESWVVGSVANVLALLAFDLPVKRLLPLLGAVIATVLAFARLDPSITVSEPIGALATPVVVVGMAALLGAALRHGERLVLQSQAELTVRSEAEIWERSATAMRSRHLAHVKEDVVPFLAQAARTGQADQQTARALAAQCRDELYLTHPLDGDTRAALRAARERGVTVTLRPGSHDPHRAWPVLRSVVARVGAEHVVTVLPDSEAEPGRIVVTPPVHADADVTVHHDDIRSTFSLSADPPTCAHALGSVGPRS